MWENWHSCKNWATRELGDLSGPHPTCLSPHIRIQTSQANQAWMSPNSFEPLIQWINLFWPKIAHHPTAPHCPLLICNPIGNSSINVYTKIIGSNLRDYILLSDQFIIPISSRFWSLLTHICQLPKCAWHGSISSILGVVVNLEMSTLFNLNSKYLLRHLLKHVHTNELCWIRIITKSQPNHYFYSAFHRQNHLFMVWIRLGKHLIWAQVFFDKI